MKFAYTNGIEKSTIVVAPEKVTKEVVKSYSDGVSKTAEQEIVK